jgi:hypothetical protein
MVLYTLLYSILCFMFSSFMTRFFALYYTLLYAFFFMTHADHKGKSLPFQRQSSTVQVRNCYFYSGYSCIVPKDFYII